MKQGKTIEELATEIVRQAQTKRDFTVPAGLMVFDAGGHIEHAPDTEDLLTPARLGFKLSGEETHFEVNPHAHSQIAGAYKIPKKYYDRMLQQEPRLLEKNVNTWLQKSDKQHLVRTLDGNARAFLSDRYRPLDNDKVAEVVLPALESVGCYVASCEVTDSKLYIKAVSPYVNFDLGVEDVVEAGIAISNSEVGGSSYKMELFLNRLVCKNGLIMPESKFVQRHLGAAFEKNGVPVEALRNETRVAADRAFWMAVRDAIAHFFKEENFADTVQKFRDAKEDRIVKSPIEAVEITTKQFGLNDLEGESVLMNLLKSGDINRFGMVNAITRTAQDVELYERATELERLGGKVLELPRSSWQEIAA